jgi:hypothetical protein
VGEAGEAAEADEADEAGEVDEAAEAGARFAIRTSTECTRASLTRVMLAPETATPLTVMPCRSSADV